MGRYRTVNVDLNRQYRNDLNQNFTDIERDIIKAESEIARVEAESKERDNLMAGTDVQAIIDRIDTSATNAELQSVYAKNQGDYAKTQGDYALEQGNYASSKGDYANEKAILADEAATNANLEASNLSQMKIDVKTATQNANTATDNANTATTNANNAATYATTQGDYAKAQGDAAKAIVDGTGLLKQTDIGELVAGFNTSGQVLDKNGNVVEGKVKSVNGVAPGEDGNITIPDASTTQKGIVQLDNTLTSTSTTQAATPNVVKQLNDIKANKEQEALKTVPIQNGGSGTLRYYKDTVGVGHVYGLVSGGTLAKDTLICTMPADYRPSALTYCIAIGGTTTLAPILLNLYADGRLVLQSNVSSTLYINFSYKID